MIGFLLFLGLFGSVFTASLFVIRRLALSYRIAALYPPEPTTEALEAWMDAYDAVLDPNSCTIEDVDAHIIEALAAADATIQHPMGTAPVSSITLPGGKTTLYWPECPVCHGQMVHGVCDLCSPHPHGSPSPACHCDKCNARYTEAERELLEAERSGERCPRCYRGRLRDGSSCDSCPYEEPPDGSPDLSAWDAEAQEFRDKAMAKAFGLPH